MDIKKALFDLENMKKPLVTVICITYNQIEFIRSCLESLVSQKCNFHFEILVHDDASTDGTQDIIKEFQQKHPELIKPILQTENQWSIKPGLLDIFYKNPLLSGTYIALCEGDDFWIGEDKLQHQVDILENHAECTVTCGSYLIIEDGKEKVVKQTKWLTENKEDSNGRVFELEDLSNSFFIKTSSAMFRNFPELFEQLKKYEFCLDMHIFYLLLRSGKGYYSKEICAGYNRHQRGVYSGSNKQDILIAQYLIVKDIYLNDQNEFFRKQYLQKAFLMINLKVSSLMIDKNINDKFILNRNPSLFEVIKDIKPVLQTSEEHRVFYKSMIPQRLKLLKQELKRLF